MLKSKVQINDKCQNSNLFEFLVLIFEIWISFDILILTFELPPLGDYLNFRVLIATSPRMMPMIQNRTMILGSAQPFNSKWW